ncbi:nicotinate-nucleotide adenylyltransferase [Tamlana fucoidanivorans]|uniref:Nicotinate-nucleotide adenylyltransferase n=1 Tax=Allotamlana fucoidanivorans TaxID=2583814 RepID=A0A5C4SRD3_9FLAO|nr:nicotinate-nucleotide adenylyltransferase [Tamlana fucoidanivorans]TNJ46409.1 nicotinate-nucleotide adenylyltransferase [Tamlana fucoidanivorans]
MKTIVNIFIGLVISSSLSAQTVNLPETLIDINYKYIASQNTNNAQNHVKLLEDEVLNFNHKEELFDQYDDAHDVYTVSFNIPKGKIIAAYNKNGKIIRTIEKYSDVRLPLEVMQAISKRFPNWGIIEDAYLIKYHCEADSLNQEYKIKIKNQDQILIVKTDEKGLFI